MADVFELPVDRPDELPRSKIEELIEARADLLDPEARLILRAIQSSNFENALDAMLEFFGNIELIDKQITFERAYKALGKAYRVFEQIDGNKDRILTRDELEAYKENRSLNEQERHSFDWLLENCVVLSRASLLTDRKGGISRGDLASAMSIFLGLIYLQRNFDQIAIPGDDGRKQITVGAINAHLQESARFVTKQERAGLLQLTLYIEALRGPRPVRKGITRTDLRRITPIRIWDPQARRRRTAMRSRGAKQNSSKLRHRVRSRDRALSSRMGR